MPQPIIVNGDAHYYLEYEKGNAILINNKDALSINKKDITVNDGGIYDPALGNIFNMDVDIKDCSCKCQNLKGNFYEGKICPLCGTVVEKTYLPNLERVGWIDLEDNYVINPEAYALITSIISESKLLKIINVDYSKSLTVEGNFINSHKINKTTQFDNIGLEQFRKRFDEIIMYHAVRKDKVEDAKYLISIKNRLFTSKIMVCSSYLKPLLISKKRNQAEYDPINRCFAVIATNADLLRKNKNTIAKVSVPSTLFTIQMTLKELFETIIKNKISGKKKITRSQVLGGRMSWSMRSVIVPLLKLDKLGLDNVIISYKGFLELFSVEILNILMNGYSGHHKFMNMTPFEIESYLNMAKYSNVVDEDIYSVMKMMIENHEEGLWMLVSRPPILAIGSCQSLRIVDVTKDALNFAMYVGLSSLTSYDGDFDGK